MRLLFDSPGRDEGPPNRFARTGPRGRRYMTAVLLVGIVGLVTREAIVVPFTVGYAAARRLVEQEDQEAQLHKQAAEYRAAAEFYRSPEGQEAAGRLALNVPAPGERRAILKPEAPGGEAQTGVRRSISDVETRLTEALHFQLRVFHRWAHDPPRQESTKTSGDKIKEPGETPSVAR